MSQTTILFLFANPTDTPQLQLGEEIRAIDEGLRGTRFRDVFDLRPHFAVQIGDLQELLLRYRPTIVHFSGHGSENGHIILQDNTGRVQPVTAEDLSDLFSQFRDHVRCVVLNACFTQIQAEAIAQHIDVVIGMSGAISDQASRVFAVAFYQALCYGSDIQSAFSLARIRVQLEFPTEQMTPRLLGNGASAISFLSTAADLKQAEEFLQQVAQTLKYNKRTDVALYARWIAAHIALLEHRNLDARVVFEFAMDEASNGPYLDFLFQCAVDLSRAYVSKKPYQAEAAAKEVLRSVRLSPSVVEAGSLCADAFWNQTRQKEAIFAYWRAAEEFELLAEEVLLSGSTSFASWLSISEYLQDREAWRTYIVGSMERLDVFWPGSFPYDENDFDPDPTELAVRVEGSCDARMRLEKAKEAYKHLEDCVASISDCGLTGLGADYFKAKDYRYYVARLDSQPNQCELEQAKDYYSKAHHLWKLVALRTTQFSEKLVKQKRISSTEKRVFRTLVTHAGVRRERTEVLQEALAEEITVLKIDKQDQEE